MSALMLVSLSTCTTRSIMPSRSPSAVCRRASCSMRTLSRSPARLLRIAASGSPYNVVVTVTDQISTSATQTNFQWTVLPPLSLENLNAGTPAGVPTLAHIFDPDSYADPVDFTPVTYGVVPTATTIVYFLSNSQLWQYDGATASLVESIDGESVIDFPFGLIAVPGRGVVFTGSGPDGYLLWFADRSGGG